MSAYLLYLGAVDGVVGGDVEIVYVRRYLIPFRDIAEVPVCRRSHRECIAQPLGFFVGFLGPYSGLKIAGSFLEEIHGYI